MRYPNFVEEKKLWGQGYKIIAGLDEAGRGPLAGPVVAAAIIVLDSKKIKIKGIRDSKKLSEGQREIFYKILINHPQIKWGIGVVSEKVIDKINILEATKLAMQKSIKNLNPDFLILDGNFKINSNILQKSIIAGDQKVFSCCAAGIVAKVTRDRLMKKMHKKYPQYGFDRHKGYGTKAHFACLEKFGPCKIHRKSFWPVKSYKT
ncbi:MAG: ribonuclease HII [Candidatus Staskawiczbacteria bacterium]|jgi:ribonuclease HII